MKMMTERQLLNLTRKICRDFGVDTPTLEFGPGENANVDHEASTIHLPSYSWVMEYRASSPLGYRLLLLHELAHWLLRCGEGHTARFYHLLLHLCVAYGVPIDFAIADERTYKPRALRAGVKLWLDELYGRDSLTAAHMLTDNAGHQNGQSEAA